jgi:DNA-binding NtrC family response regulator
MMSFHWPGNLRELHNAADRFVLGLSDEEWVAAVVRDYQRVGCAWTLMFVVNDFERACCCSGRDLCRLELEKLINFGTSLKKCCAAAGRSNPAFWACLIQTELQKNRGDVLTTSEMTIKTLYDKNANWLSNRIFKSFEEIVDHCCYAWNTLIDQPWKIMSVARRDWAVAGHSLWVIGKGPVKWP